MASPVDTARRLAEEVLLPDAGAVDTAERVPEAHLRALDAAGLTGLAGTAASLADRFDATAALAGGCLATAFVWLQHQGALAAVTRSTEAAARFAPDLASGRLRAGVVITAVRGPRPMRLRPADGGWTISGSASWVSGWGIAEVLRVAAIADDGAVVTVLADVGAAMRADPAPLVAANASGTVSLEIEDLRVPADRLIDRVPAETWAAGDAAGLALNGALALGIAHRAAFAAASEPLLAEIARVRAALLTADVAGLPAARAACSALALRAAAALAVHDGGRGLIRGSSADRLLREAHLLLAFGSRPGIRAALQEELGAGPATGVGAGR